MMSLAERKVVASRHPWTLPQLTEIDELMQPTAQRPRGNTSNPTTLTMGRAELSRRKYFSQREAFSGRSVKDAYRERIQGDSMVEAELKTNVIIGDEFIFITDLSAKIAETYRRPLSSIAVQIQHSACIFFAGTFEPAYIMTVSALAECVESSTNQRNAKLLTEHLEEALGVSSSRGLIRFTAIPDGNVAFNGETMAQALEEDSRAGRPVGIMDEELPTSFARGERMSVKSLANIKGSPLAGEITLGAEENAMVGEKPELAKAARRRKSFVAGLFGKPSSKKEEQRKGLDVPRASV